MPFRNGPPRGREAGYFPPSPIPGGMKVVSGGIKCWSFQTVPYTPLKSSQAPEGAWGRKQRIRQAFKMGEYLGWDGRGTLHQGCPLKGASGGCGHQSLCSTRPERRSQLLLPAATLCSLQAGLLPQQPCWTGPSLFTPPTSAANTSPFEVFGQRCLFCLRIFLLLTGYK